MSFETEKRAVKDMDIPDARESHLEVHGRVARRAGVPRGGFASRTNTAVGYCRDGTHPEQPSKKTWLRPQLRGA